MARITINIDKAREITKERLREERKPLLEALDVQFMRSLEQSVPVPEIAAEKQRLRDITNIQHINSIDELKALKVQ